MENLKVFSIYKHVIVLGILLGMSPISMSADKVDAVVDTGLARAGESKASQQRVDKTAASTEKVASKYKRELKVIDGLKVYNALLNRQVEDQEIEKIRITDSIDEIAVIERQIFPLMLRMVDSLEQFIDLDVPFHMDERRKRIANLKDSIGDAGITASEKLRLVLEAYRIETDFGGDLDAYTELQDVDGKERKVNVLRFGRISLVYQTEDELENAVWDQKSRSWVRLDSTEYANHIKKGLKIARKQTAPELFILPISAAE
jgi:hypothetical protein